MDSYLPIILDVLLAAVLAAAFFIGYKRGFLRTVWGIAAVILSIVLTIVIQPYTNRFFENSPLCFILEDRVYSMVYDHASSIAGTSDGEPADSAEIAPSAEFFESAYSLPEKYAKQAAGALNNAADIAASSAAAAAADTVTSIAEVILLFIAIRLLLAIIHSILKLIFKFPVLKQTNKLAGGIAQTVLALTAIYAVFAVSAAAGWGAFDHTILCRQLYDHNLLLTLLELW